MNRTILLSTLLFTAACGDEPGTIELNTWGEEYIEVEIPKEEFEDQWSIQFSKFLIVLSGIRVEGADGEVAHASTSERVYDLTKAGPTKIETIADVPARRYERVSVEVKPATAAAVAGGETAAADVEAMKAGAFSVWVQGTATSSASPGVTKRFDWSFDTATRYEDCEPVEGGEGLVVPGGGSVNAQLTVHGDHFFYDDLQSTEAKLRFAALGSADRDGDGEVTLDELSAVQLSDLPSTRYKVGTVPSVRNLREFVSALTRTLVHFQGEGECRTRVL